MSEAEPWNESSIGTVRATRGVVLLAVLAACGPDARPPVHWLVQVDDEPTHSEREGLAARGVRYVSRQGPGRWWVSVDPDAPGLDDVEWTRAGPVAPDEKLAPDLGTWTDRRRVVVAAHADVERPLDLVGASALPERMPVAGWLTAELTMDEVRDLAARDDVRRIAPLPDDGRDRPLNDTVRARTGADEIQGFVLVDGLPTYEGYSGEGLCAAVFDAGLIAPHVDMGDRLLNPGPGDGHAEAVAGIIGGDGTASQGHGGTPYQWRGMAPEVLLVGAAGAPFTSSWQMAGYLFEDTVDVTNSSLALMIEGQYDERSAAIDAVIRGSAGKPLPSIIAAANNGLGPQYGVLRGYYSVLANAKNALVVGALLANEENRWRGSSMGPTWDGRTVPHVLAPADWLTWPPHGRMVAIDYLRFENDIGEVGFSYEFDAASDRDGWRSVQNVSGWEVVGGEMRFLSEIVGIVMSPDDLSVDPAYHWLVIRAKVAEEPDERSRGALIEWGTSPYCTDRCRVWTRAAGNAWREARAGDEWDVYRVDVAAGGAAIDWVRFRPYDGSSRATYGPIFDEKDPAAYGEHGQTSMAGPVGSGAAVLLLDALQTTTGRDPLAQPFLSSTVRAILIDTAIDLVKEEEWIVDGRNADTGRPPRFGPGPDFATGFGRIDVAAAVRTAEEGRFVEDAVHEGETRVFEMDVPDGTPRLSVTLAWDDPPADPGTPWEETKLVHDLDLVVTDGAGFVAMPWTLAPPPHEPLPSENGVQSIDPDTDLPNATRGEDHVNNVEKVEVDDPPAGTLRIEVSAPRVLPEGPWQTFSLSSNLHFSIADPCEETSERCNGLDDDCDDAVDEDLADEAEVCEGLDNDCDGSIDEGCPCDLPRPCIVAATGCRGLQDCPFGEYGECVTEPGCPPEEDAGPGDDAGIDDAGGDAAADAGGDAGTGRRREDDGCGCSTAGTGWGMFSCVVLAALAIANRRRVRQSAR